MLVDLSPALVGEVDSIEDEELVDAMTTHSPAYVSLLQRQARLSFFSNNEGDFDY